MTESTELAVCSDCNFLMSENKLRPYGADFALICIQCAYRNEEIAARTRANIRVHINHTLNDLIAEVMAEYGPVVIAISMNDLLDILNEDDEDD